MSLPFRLMVPRARPCASNTCIGELVATAAGELNNAVVEPLELLDSGSGYEMTELDEAALELNCAALDIPYSYAPRSGAPPT